jgi:hypothetical protein
MMKDFKSWARNQLEKAERKTGLEKILPKTSRVCCESIKRVSLGTFPFVKEWRASPKNARAIMRIAAKTHYP